jgi:bifunctional DNase/RNase
VRQVDVVGVRLELPSNQPVLILRDQQATRYLPLWIGSAEATAISLALEGVEPQRPLTHDLLAATIVQLGGQVTSVTVSELIEGTFYATINFLNHDSISARPSDAVALAVRNKVPVFVAQDVMDLAGMDLALDDDFVADDASFNETEMSQEDLDKFRAFLDEIQPEDFS